MKSNRTSIANMNRRAVLGTMTGAGALMALGIPAARAQEAKRGGHVRYGVRGGSTSDTLDPATFGNTFMRTLG